MSIAHASKRCGIPEEDYNDAKRGTRIESCAEYIIVLCPPREVPSADDVLEDESNYCPRNIVHGCGRGNSTSTGEYNREATHNQHQRIRGAQSYSLDISKNRVRPLQGDKIGNERTECSDKEKEHKSVVDLPFRKL